MEWISSHITDCVVVLFYLIGINIIGIWAGRKIQNTAEFFMPRKFGKLMMVMFSFGTGTHADQAVSVASKSFTNGFSGVWYQWLFLPVTPFYWLIAPMFRRLRAVTTADVFEARFDVSVAILFAIFGISNLAIDIGFLLKSTSVIIAPSTGYLVSSNIAVTILAAMFVIYGVAGGLTAAIVTDFLQGILTLIFSFLLLPFILHAIGGMQGIHQSIKNPALLSLVAPSDINFFYVAIIAFNALVGSVAGPTMLGNCAAGKTEVEGQVGLVTGCLLKRLCTIPWCLTGVAAIVYFAGRNIEPDDIYGSVAAEFLPRVVPGLLGLFIACVLASVMSACAACMTSAAALFTENAYKRMVCNKTEKHYIFIGRIASIAVVISGVVFAYWIPNVVKGLEILWIFYPMMGIAFWLGLFWRRTTVAGAWASTIIGFASWWLTTLPSFISFMADFPGSKSLHFVTTRTTGQEIYLPWQMIFYILCSVIGGIIVSLLTKPVAEKKLDNFYALLRTPIKPGETIITSCTLPSNTVVPERRNLLPIKNIEIPVPSRNAVFGFLAICLICAAFIYLFYLITL